MLKHKLNANGIIVHPKNLKMGAQTTSANTANVTAANSPKIKKNPFLNKNNL
jgi:hypothetical protein